jgi:putative ABC transport system permease protein
MVGITLADLRYRYRQFLIAVVAAGVVLAMAILLAGLAEGFRSELNGTVGGVGADRWVLSAQSFGRVSAVATFDEAAVAELASTPGVTRAGGIVLLPQEVVRAGGKLMTVNVMGVDGSGLGLPHAVNGHTLGADGEIVVDSKSSIAVGSTVLLGSVPLRVVGRVSGRTMSGGVPMVYVTLHDAQAALLGGSQVVTAVVTSGVPSAVPAGLITLTNAQVVDKTLSAMSGALGTIKTSRTIMWGVAAIIIVALVYVSALQRVRDFAVLKALGSSSASLFGSLCLQALLVSAYTALPIVAVVVAVVASLVALRRATGADPAAAFG